MSIRQQRLADQIRDLVAGCFMGGQMQDPRLQDVAITAVKLSGDLQLASVYFRVIGEDRPSPKTQDVQVGLERAEGFLKRKLAANLDVRRVPSLRFFYDESVETGARIERLLAELK